jgi:hypothetical protein
MQVGLPRRNGSVQHPSKFMITHFIIAKPREIASMFDAIGTHSRVNNQTSLVTWF